MCTPTDNDGSVQLPSGLNLALRAADFAQVLSAVGMSVSWFVTVEYRDSSTTS